VLEKENGMLLKSILNRVQLHHGFVYGAVRLLEKAARLILEIEIRPRVGDHQNITKSDHVAAVEYMLKTDVGLEYLS
jgi:hypothetical protein